MTKHSAEEILCSIKPVKSVKSYNKAWEDFEAFVGSDERGEEEFIWLFNHLRNERNMASITLWSVYSMINYTYQMKTGCKLQMFPRLTVLLKSYEANYTRKKASVFTKEQFC